MKPHLVRLIDFAIKTFIVAIAVYLGIVALFMGVFTIFDRVDNVLVDVKAQGKRVDHYMDLIFSKKEEKGSEFTLLKWGISGLIENPEIHYRLAKEYAAKGEFRKALIEESLALAIVDPDVNKYKEFYKQLEDEVNKTK